MESRPAISVLYVTNKPEGLDILRKDLITQIFDDFEVILVDELGRQEMDWKCIKGRPKNEGDVWNLNKAYNDGIKLCEGDLTVFLQDYIWIPPDAFQKMWEWYDIYKEEAAFCTGGYGALEPTWLEYKSGDLRPRHYTENSIKNDRSGVNKIDWQQYEINFACCPTQSLKETMFDERMDKYYGCDNQILAYNLYIKGMMFFQDNDIKKIGFPDYFPKPNDWEEKHANKIGLEQLLWTLRKS